MADQDSVRRIARGLPGAIEGADWFGFSVDVKGKAKGFAWTWRERVDPKKARVAQPKVLAVRVANQEDKAALLDADPAKFFTEPHYNGYPAVLVRLPEVSEAELAQVLLEAWRCVAPRPLVAAYEAGVASDALSGGRTSAKKPAPKKPAAKKSVAKKSVAKKSAAKKSVAKKSVAKKPAPKKPAPKKPAPKKPAPKRR